MILKTTCAFLALILEILGVYGDGEFKWYYGYVLLLPLKILLSFINDVDNFGLEEFFHPKEVPKFL